MASDEMVVGKIVGTSVGDAMWTAPVVRPAAPSYVDNLDSATIAGGGGDVIVAPEELDKFSASLQQYVDELSAQVDFNASQLARRSDVLIGGPHIRGVTRAVAMAAETTDHLMRTLAMFQDALRHDVAAVQAARLSYVGTDETAAQDISKAGGAAV